MKTVDKKKILNDNIVIEDAPIVFRNFSGKEGKFNPAGRRNFCVLITEELANHLVDDGWNVRWLEPKDVEDPKQPYLPVAVSYANFKPKVVLITEKGKTILDENTINILDWAEIKEVDLVIRPYNWEVSGKSGVKAYVKAMYVTIKEDIFAEKYSNTPDSASNTSRDVFVEDETN